MRDEAVETGQDSLTVGELAGVMDDRAAFYRFMGQALLQEFTTEQIGQLEALGALETDSDEAREALATIRRYLGRAGLDPRTDLAVDYARVFLSAGVYDGVTAEPYESVFTSEDHLLMQDARDDAVRAYRRWGVDVDPALHMPEDHLGIELNFLAVMAARTADALRAAEGADGEGEAAHLTEARAMVDAQRDFLERHVLNWLDDLIAKVDEFAQLPFYPALMRWARSYLVEDEALLAEVSAALA